ncbi:hypothetical protein IP88_15100 [alpha proteobacterium AAP81b]|nr:hypothetical protein IP88_15100 [alpha proteobacterium AAP81b]
MRRLDFARAALADLDAIYRHSLTEFGEAQADHYAGMIDAAFQLLAEFPEAGVLVPDRVDGLRRRNVGAHAILYQALTNRVRIVRLLHQRMDPNRHL